MKKDKKIKTFEDLLDHKYGKIGTLKRDEFDYKSKTLIIGELIKAERKRANMTQDELARKARTKKSYISRIEKGKSDIQLSTLFRIVEEGLGRRVNFSIG